MNYSINVKNRPFIYIYIINDVWLPLISNLYLASVERCTSLSGANKSIYHSSGLYPAAFAAPPAPDTPGAEKVKAAITKRSDVD